MKILVVHQYYLLPGWPGGSRFNEMARAWADQGHEVTVVAGVVDYATGVVPEQYRRRWTVREQDGPVSVWRCYVPGSYNRGYVGRALALVAFMFSASTAALLAGRPDVVIATSPPLLAALPGWIAARWRWRPVPWIFEVRDLWPESAITTGVLPAGSLLARLLYRFERWACASATRINVLTPAFADDIVQRGLAGREKILFVPNGADTEIFTPSEQTGLRRDLGWGDRFVVLYAGAHGRANAIGQLVDAADELKDRPDILVVTVGEGPERLRWEQEAKTRGLTNIVFLGSRAKSGMPRLVSAADAGAAVLQDNPTFKTVYPNKVFDYMASGRPVVLAIDGIARTLVCDEARAGVFAPPEQPKALAAAIRGLADDPAEARRLGLNGRTWVLAHASRSALAAKYLGFLSELGSLAAESASVHAGTSRNWCSVKRLFDIVAGASALVLLAPVLMCIWAVVRLFFGAPAIFRQERAGLNGRGFSILKFRTMTKLCSSSGTLLPDEDRLTRLGRFLRGTSLDELPELWNVLKGDMSLVGPRPLLVRYLARYTAEELRRHEVTPGITGWAQVNGRNALTWRQKFEFDLWYVENRSFFLDLRILAMTIGKTLRRDGISQPGEATAAEFFGSEQGQL